MARSYRFAAQPRWLVGHLVVLALCVTMVLLGRWQLTVSDRKHFSLQNFGYALQWWAFTGFGLVMWARILRDAARGPRDADGATPGVGAAGGTDRSQLPEGAAGTQAPVAYRRYVMPQSSDGPAASHDSTHAAYNEYLAALAERDEDR